MKYIKKYSEELKSILAFIVVFLIVCGMAYGATPITTTPEIMKQWRPHITREAQAIYGINAPIPMLAGQIWQESGGREKVTAWDGGMSLGQFMPNTVKQIVSTFPELAPADPYSGIWSIRAQVRYLGWMRQRTKGIDDCHRWSAVLKGYNAGLGYVQRAQKRSPEPGIWYGVTEDINPGQSEKNFVYSRAYPRWIIYRHQHRFVTWGNVVCDIYNPIYDSKPFR